VPTIIDFVRRRSDELEPGVAEERA
jgi:hypothetical protein